MTDTTINASTLEKTISLKLSMEAVNTEVEKRLKKVARTARMPGFRPGKVPMKMVLQNYGPQVHSDVLNDEIGRVFNQEVSKRELRVAGQPRIEAAKDVSEDSFEFNAVFEVYPEVKFGDFSSLEIEKTVVKVSDVDVDKTIEILRQQRAVFVEVERASAEGDRVTVDFVGQIDNVAFDGGTSQDFSFQIGKGQMLPEFELAATGLMQGQEKTFPLTFPVDYKSNDLAGKSAQFTIVVKKVEESQLPEFNEDFARAMGVEDGSIEKLREDVRVNLSREVENRAKAQTKESVMNALLKVTSFDVPRILVESETTELATRARQELKARGVANVQEIQLPEGVFEAQAQRRVRLGLIVSDLTKKNNLQAKPEQVRAYIEEQAQSYENPVEVMQWFFQDRARLADVEAIILEDNVVEFTLNQSKVIESPLTFDELMGKK